MDVSIDEDRWVAARTEEVVAAGTDPTLWAGMPARLGKGWPGARALVFGWSARGHSLGLLHHGYDPTQMEAYERRYARLNPWLPILQRQPVLRAGISDDTLPWRAIVNTEFYNDFLKRQPESEHAAGIKIVDGGGRFAAITFQYGHGVADAYNERLPRVMQRLAPALRAAFDLSRALVDAQAWQLRAGGLLEAFEMPAVVVDSRRVPRLANKAAEVLLAGGELLRQDARGRLGTCSVSATNELVQRLSAISRPGEVVRGELTVRDSLGVPLALISLLPLDGTVVASAMSRLFAPERFALLLVRRLDPGATTPSERRLRTVFSMTDAEARLATRLAAGASLAEAAAAFGISHETARVQLRAIFVKTRTHRQAELVALIARL